MTPWLAARDLARWYGEVIGVNDLTLDLEARVVGLVGPNGAGKSTLLQLAVGALRPSRGEVRVLGERPFANASLHRRLGVCPQRDALWDDLSGAELVRLLTRLSGFGAREARARAERALDRAGLGDARRRRVGTYSKGMRQRVKLAQAIAHEPDVLVLDEPLTGLDPFGRRETLALLAELADGGTRVLLSSHVLHEVEEPADEVVLLHRGRLLAQGPVEEVRALLVGHPRKVVVRAREPRRLAAALAARPDVLALRVDEGEGEGGAGGRLELETRDLDALLGALTALGAEGGYGVSELTSADAGLEAVFDYLVGAS